MGIQGREFTIGQILSSATGRVEVPLHQRPYSWEASELRELWQDILTFSDNLSGKTPDKKQYFLGSIVGQIKSDDGTIEVLDGQQRLATVTIILAAIRDLLFESGSQNQNLALKVHLNNIAATTKYLGGPEEFVLRLGKSDDSFFRQVVLAFPPDTQKTIKPKTASQQAIVRAKLFFRARIIELAASLGISADNVALRLHQIITNHLMVVRVASESWDDVTDIFERLNDRGKGLSTLDLLRVYLIGKASKVEQGDVEEAWATVYELSQSATKVDAFLRHSWITHKGDVKSRSLYKEIKAVLEDAKQPAPLNSTLAFSQSLASDAELYRTIVEGQHPDDRCSYWLRAIGTIGATSLLPAALAGSVTWTNASEYPKYATLLKQLVTVFMRANVITEGESTVLEEAAFKVARMVRAGATIEEASSELRLHLKDDDVVRKAFSELALSRTGYQRYVLEALEDYLSHPGSEMPPEKPVAGAKTLWIEHIYPQAPDQHWGRWRDHDSYINRIGNLTLIHKKLNAGAKNKALPEKKKYYADSGLYMNKELEQLDNWSPSVIDDRQAAFARAVTHIWATF
jgi:hypothetical protein